MYSSNCCFLTCIQISQEAGQVVWYFHLFQIFPQFIVIHTVKGFSIINKCFSGTLLLFWWSSVMLAIWSLVPLSFLKPAWISGSSWFMYCWSLAWRILSITLLECEMSARVQFSPCYCINKWDNVRVLCTSWNTLQKHVTTLFLFFIFYCCCSEW